MKERLDQHSGDNYHNKKLSEEDIELLERQGFFADINNKLGSLTTLISICELLESDDEKKYQLGKQLLTEAITQSKCSIAHIIAAQKHIAQEKDPVKLKSLLEGTH